MKYFKHTLLFTIISLFLINISCINAYADTTTELTPSKKNLSADGMSYDAYDVNIKVNEDNTFDIVEKIDVNFVTSKHGIFRTLI